MLNPIQINVTASGGTVHLTGAVDSFSRKTELCQVVKQVAGVLAVTDNIEVVHPEEDSRSDLQIKDDVGKAFYWNRYVPANKITVNVDNGHVLLEGELLWHYERMAAENAVAHVEGIRGLTNNILIVSEAMDQVEKKDIEDAIARNWSINAGNISVSVLGNSVTLDGIVDSIYQKEEAERISWNAPGVSAVENKIRVRSLRI